MPKKVFVSYRSTERQHVRKLVAAIEQAGDYEVWYDQEIIGGQAWWDEILKALESAEIVVLSLSQSYLKSEACRLEMDYARRLGKAVLPVQIDPSLDYARLGQQLVSQHLLRFFPDEERSEELKKALSAAQPGTPSSDISRPPAPISPLAHAQDVIESPGGLPPDEQQHIVDALRRHVRRYPNESTRIVELLNIMMRRPEITREVHQEASEIVASIPAPASPKPPGMLAVAAILLVGVVIIGGFFIMRNENQPVSTPTAPAKESTQSLQNSATEDPPAVQGQTGAFDLTLIYGARDSFTIKLNNQSHLFGLTLEAAGDVENVASSFEALGAVGFVGETGTCLRYTREGTQPTLPRGCNAALTFEVVLGGADVFWFNDQTNQYRDMTLKQNGTFIGTCPHAGGSGRCDFRGS